MTPRQAATEPPTKELAAQVRAGDRRALAQAITLMESSRPEHRPDAEALLGLLGPLPPASVRIGISGPPGVGKSTFIEAAGLCAVAAGHRVAVLAVDPSSTVSGGSVLGDKVRMVKLAAHPDAFVRPSPAGRTLGGTARRTGDAVRLVAAAGFDVIVVETTGVGQAELAVANLVDVFVVLVGPGSGDELQGMKRGIMELADVVVVNKADGDLAAAAQRVAADYRTALGLLRPRWQHGPTPVLACSSLDAPSVAEVWAALEYFVAQVRASGELAGHRRRQAVATLYVELDAAIVDAVRADPLVAQRLAELEPRVAAGALSPTEAVRQVLAGWSPG